MPQYYLRSKNPVTGDWDYLRMFNGRTLIFTDVKKTAIAFGDEVSAHVFREFLIQEYVSNASETRVTAGNIHTPYLPGAEHG